MKKIAAIILSVVLVCSLAACADSGNQSTYNDKATQATQQQQAESSSTVADKDAYGQGEKTEQGEYLADMITVGVQDSITTFNPFTAAGRLENAVVNIQEYLGVCTTDGALKFVMLKSVDKVDDLTYDCEIWDFITDTDGNNITANDVQYCVEERHQNGQRISGYDHMDVTGDYTFTIHCSEPFAAGEYEKMFSNPIIVSQKAFEESKDDMASAPVGTGPYKLKEFMEGSYAVFEVNEDYWYNNIDDEEWLKANDCPDVYQNFKSIRVDTIGDASQRAIALENGSVDAASSLNAVDVAAFDASKVLPVLVPEKAPINMVFNCSESSILHDENLRKAICYAIDNEAIALGLDIPAYPSYGIQPRMFDAPASWMGGRDYYNHDQSKVDEYLEAAGYNGEPIGIYFNADSTREAVLVMVQAQLKDAGINASLTSYEKATSPRGDFTAWDIMVDRSGGGSYLANTLSRWYTPGTNNEYDGKQEFGVVDTKIDELYENLIADVNDITINAWDDYFTFEKCYAYSVCVYDNQSGCSSQYKPACTMDRYRLCPGAFTLAD